MAFEVTLANVAVKWVPAGVDHIGHIAHDGANYGQPAFKLEKIGATSNFSLTSFISGYETRTATGTLEEVKNEAVEIMNDAGLAAGSTDANPTALAISSGTLDPVFGATVGSYAASIANATANITVTVTAAQANSITVNGTVVASGAATANIPMAVGANTVTIVITAPNRLSQKTITIVVTRAAP